MYTLQREIEKENEGIHRKREDEAAWHKAATKAL
jgi:hypothetical protein